MIIGKTMPSLSAISAQMKSAHWVLQACIKPDWTHQMGLHVKFHILKHHQFVDRNGRHGSEISQSVPAGRMQPGSRLRSSDWRKWFSFLASPCCGLAAFLATLFEEWPFLGNQLYGCWTAQNCNLSTSHLMFWFSYCWSWCCKCRSSSAPCKQSWYAQAWIKHRCLGWIVLPCTTTQT